MIGILLGAAILGIIVSAMEQGEFPGWGKMVLCVLAAVVPAIVVNLALPPDLFFIGLAVGAVCAAFAIAGLTGMSLKRAFIAAGIWFGVQTLISLALNCCSAGNKCEAAAMRWVLVLVVGFVLTSAAGAVEPFVDAELNLRLTPPEGFVPAGDLVKGSIVCAFEKRAPDGGGALIILVHRLEGSVSRDGVSPNDPEFRGRPVTTTRERWKGFELVVASAPLNNEGDVMCLVQVPLKPQAIQISVAGPAGREDEVRQVLRSTLEGLEGEPKWRSSEEVRGGLVKIAAALCAVFVGLPALVGFVVWRLIRGRKPKRRRSRDEGRDYPR